MRAFCNTPCDFLREKTAISETKLTPFDQTKQNPIYPFIQRFTICELLTLKKSETFAQNGLRTNAQWTYNLIWMYIHMTPAWHHLNIFSCMHYVLSRKAAFSTFLTEINFFPEFYSALGRVIFRALRCFPIRPKVQSCSARLKTYELISHPMLQLRQALCDFYSNWSNDFKLVLPKLWNTSVESLR